MNRQPQSKQNEASVVLVLAAPPAGFSYHVTTNPDGSLTVKSVRVEAKSQVQKPIKRTDAAPKKVPLPIVKADDDTITIYPSMIYVSENEDVTIYDGATGYTLNFESRDQQTQFYDTIGAKSGVAFDDRATKGNYQVEIRANGDGDYDFISI
jgi:hypothetical protein